MHKGNTQQAHLFDISSRVFSSTTNGIANVRRTARSSRESSRENSLTRTLTTSQRQTPATLSQHGSNRAAYSRHDYRSNSRESLGLSRAKRNGSHERDLLAAVVNGLRGRSNSYDRGVADSTVKKHHSASRPPSVRSISSCGSGGSQRSSRNNKFNPTEYVQSKNRKIEEIELKKQRIIHKNLNNGSSRHSRRSKHHLTHITCLLSVLIKVSRFFFFIFSDGSSDKMRTPSGSKDWDDWLGMSKAWFMALFTQNPFFCYYRYTHYRCFSSLSSLVSSINSGLDSDLDSVNSYDTRHSLPNKNKPNLDKWSTDIDKVRVLQFFFYFWMIIVNPVGRGQWNQKKSKYFGKDFLMIMHRNRSIYKNKEIKKGKKCFGIERWESIVSVSSELWPIHRSLSDRLCGFSNLISIQQETNKTVGLVIDP